MNNRAWMAATVLVSSAAAVAISLLLQPRLHVPDAALRDGFATLESARMEGLSERIRALEEKAEPVQATNTLPGPTRVEVSDPASEQRLAALEKRLRQVEALVAALMRGDRRADVASESIPPPGPPPRREPLPDKDAAVRTLTDGRATIEDKMRAHEALRHVADAYTPAMVQELMHVGATHSNGAVRADVWRFFDGASKLPVLIAPLVRALAFDPDPRVREEAADTLGSYVSDPAVIPALQQAAQADSVEAVRAKAKRTLATSKSFRPKPPVDGR